MASRIKGITVEIGGDTTGLEKALKGVNSAIKTTQSELKDVERLLKLDPSNTELLTQKQKLLKDAISSTSEKLETLKEAQKQAKEQLERGELGQDKYDALQREIIETEQELRRLQEQAATTSVSLEKLAVAGEKFEKAGDSITNAGKKVSVASAAVTGLGVAAVKTAADFDSAMANVAAISGATGNELQALRDKAREMGEKTKFSASEAADAMSYMAMAGWKTGDMLSGIEGIMNLAAASGEDLAATSDIVTDALTAFGLTAEDSAHFADILAAASSNANTNVSMMGETFKYCAPVAGALGYSVEDVAEAIGLMGNAGIKSTQAGTALRTMMTKLQGELKLSGEALGEVTIQTANADGSMRELSDILSDCRTAFSKMSESEAAAAAETLVGKNAMSGFLALMNSAPGDIDKLRNAIDNCDGSAENMAAIMQDNLNGQLTILKSQLEELAISFGEMLMPVIRKVVTAVQGFVDKLNNMDAVVREIYAMYLSGMGTIAISNVLNDRGLKTSRGNPWGTNSILEIISNEKYTGDSLMGKHVRVKGVHMDNTGGRYSKQYMVENTHEAIVSHETFDKAQAERARRKNPKMVGVQHDPHDFTGLIECGVCGMRFNHKVNSSGLKWQNPIWACHNQLKHTKKACDNTRIKEDVLCDKFVEAYNRFVIERPCGHSVRAMEIRVKTLQDEERDLAGLALKHLIPDAAFRAEQKKLKAEIAALTERICEQTSKEVTEADYTVITEYDPEKVKKFVTKVIVLKGTVSFVFYNGVEITLEYSNGAPGNKPGWNAKEA